MSVENIITMMAVVGSALTIFFNLKKFGDNIEKETRWRVDVNKDLDNLLDKVNRLLASYEKTASLVDDLKDFRTEQKRTNEDTAKSIKKLWERSDERKTLIDTLQKDVDELKRSPNGDYSGTHKKQPTTV